MKYSKQKKGRKASEMKVDFASSETVYSLRSFKKFSCVSEKIAAVVFQTERVD